MYELCMVNWWCELSKQIGLKWEFCWFVWLDYVVGNWLNEINHMMICLNWLLFDICVELLSSCLIIVLVVMILMRMEGNRDHVTRMLRKHRGEWGIRSMSLVDSLGWNWDRVTRSWQMHGQESPPWVPDWDLTDVYCRTEMHHFTWQIIALWSCVIVFMRLLIGVLATWLWLICTSWDVTKLGWLCVGCSLWRFNWDERSVCIQLCFTYWLVICLLSIELFGTHSLLLHLCRLRVLICMIILLLYFVRGFSVVIWEVTACHDLNGPSCSFLRSCSTLETKAFVNCNFFQLSCNTLVNCTRDNQVLRYLWVY